MDNQTRKGNGALMVGMILGGLVGAGYGIWNAPSSGETLRRDTLNRARALFRQAESTVLGESSADAIAEGKAMAQQRQIELSLD